MTATPQTVISVFLLVILKSPNEGVGERGVLIENKESGPVSLSDSQSIWKSRGLPLRSVIDQQRIEPVTSIHYSTEMHNDEAVISAKDVPV